MRIIPSGQIRNFDKTHIVCIFAVYDGNKDAYIPSAYIQPHIIIILYCCFQPDALIVFIISIYIARCTYISI